MIVTDPSSRPSERFLQAVTPFFAELGYELKRSKNAFEREFKYGKQFVGFWFRISQFVRVELYWSIQFLEFEKLLARINGHPKRYKSSMTVSTTLGRYQKENNVPVDDYWNLYDLNTYLYDDFSINAAADKVKGAYKTDIAPFFERISDYRSLEQYYGTFPARWNAHILLASLVDDPDIGNLIKHCFEIAEKQEPEDKDQMITRLNNTLAFIQQNDIKTLLG